MQVSELSSAISDVQRGDRYHNPLEVVKRGFEIVNLGRKALEDYIQECEKALWQYEDRRIKVPAHVIYVPDEVEGKYSRRGNPHYDYQYIPLDIRGVYKGLKIIEKSHLVGNLNGKEVGHLNVCLNLNDLEEYKSEYLSDKYPMGFVPIDGIQGEIQ
jgi:hypothetical protein